MHHKAMFPEALKQPKATPSRSKGLLESSVGNGRDKANRGPPKCLSRSTKKHPAPEKFDDALLAESKVTIAHPQFGSIEIPGDKFDTNTLIGVKREYVEEVDKRMFRYRTEKLLTEKKNDLMMKDVLLDFICRYLHKFRVALACAKVCEVVEDEGPVTRQANGDDSLADALKRKNDQWRPRSRSAEGELKGKMIHDGEMEQQA